MASPCVLHVTSLLGGGVDRHVRDIVTATRGPHLVWHVGESAEAMEIPSDSRYLALDPPRVDGDPDAMHRWLASRSVGIVHAHSLNPKAKQRAAYARSALGASSICTLHDVLFLRRDAFEPGAPLEPEPAWLEANARFLRECDAVVAPSDFIANVARTHIEALDVTVVPNGSRPRTVSSAPARPEFFEHAPRHVVLVLGAIGPHKGSDMLEALGALLQGSGIAIVVIGYLDRQLLPGWRAPGTLFVHGAYADDDVPALVDAYGARIALFPNRVPESFSYALSDVWSCGLPVLAAPRGALAERIHRHGGGWLLPQDFDASLVAARLDELLSDAGKAELARVELQLSRQDPERIPPLDAMARSLEALYARFGLKEPPSSVADASAIERLLATNLDGSLFRVELTRIADEFAQEARAHAQTLATARQFEADTRAWITKLDQDVAVLGAELQREVEERRRLGEENARLRVDQSAFLVLPKLLRRILLKIANARS